MRKSIIPIAFLLLISALTVCAEDGAVMPGFLLENMSGGKESLNAVRGDFTGPIIVTFWASWCSPCKKEMPQLQRILESTGSDKLRVVGISLDKPEKINKAKMFVKNKNFGFTYLFDPNGLYGKKKLHIPAVPHLVLLDGENRMVYRHTGYKPGDEKELEVKIAELIGEGVEAVSEKPDGEEGKEPEKSD